MLKPEYSRYLAKIQSKISEFFGHDIKGRFEFIDKLASYDDFSELPEDILEKLQTITGEIPSVKGRKFTTLKKD